MMLSEASLFSDYDVIWKEFCYLAVFRVNMDKIVKKRKTLGNCSSQYRTMPLMN
jgi:hypothetical protein